MTRTIEQRLSKVEEQLNEILKAREWLPLTEAAPLLNRSVDTLRRRIREAKQDPTSSPYKKGIHWRQTGGKKVFYEIHLKTWRNIALKVAEEE